MGVSLPFCNKEWIIYENLSKYFYKPYFWTDSYFITTVGENTKDIVKTYIDNQ